MSNENKSYMIVSGLSHLQSENAPAVPDVLKLVYKSGGALKFSANGKSYSVRRASSATGEDVTDELRIQMFDFFTFEGGASTLKISV